MYLRLVTQDNQVEYLQLDASEKTLRKFVKWQDTNEIFNMLPEDLLETLCDHSDRLSNKPAKGKKVHVLPNLDLENRLQKLIWAMRAEDTTLKSSPRLRVLGSQIGREYIKYRKYFNK